jgi:ABC-type transport system involved in cytochrome c biogenesis permease subunit
MRELQATGWIKLKAVLFLCAGLLASALLVLDRPTLKVVFLVAVAIWAFCRTYYFAFYVLERYVDPGYRFSGLASLLRHLAGSRK